MIQTRLRIFETNSSTTHSISIPKKVDIDPQKIRESYGSTITFGVKSWSELRKSLGYGWIVACGSTSFQDRADLLYYSTYLGESCYANQFILDRDKIRKALKGIGINVEFKEDLDACDEYFNASYDDSLDMLGAVIDNDKILEYLFAPDFILWYWCDECCPDFPKEIEEYLDKLPYDDYITTTER